MKPISTSTLGMSAAFSTTNPACRAGFVSMPHVGLQLGRPRSAPAGGAHACFPPDEAGQDLRDLGRRVPELRAAEPVGAVLPLGERRGLRVGRGVGKGIDARAHARGRTRLRVHRDEQRRPRRAWARATRSWSGMNTRAARVSSTRQRPPALQLPLAVPGRRRGPRASRRCRKPMAPGSLPPCPGSSMTSGAFGP